VNGRAKGHEKEQRNLLQSFLVGEREMREKDGWDKLNHV
jgi:hypothetical protein